MSQQFHLLDQQAPGLVAELCSLSVVQQRVILVSVCRFMNTQFTDLDPAARGLLREAAVKSALSDDQVGQAHSLAERADTQYLALQERSAPEAEWLYYFSQARLLSGLAIGFKCHDCTGIADALYEFSGSLANPSEMFALVRSSIKQLRNNELPRG